MLKTFTLGVVALLLLGLVAACGKSTESQVSVDLSEWSIKPSVASVRAGKVTFTVHNVGSIEHEVVLLKTDLAPDRLTLKADGTQVDEEALNNVGEVPDLDKGETKTGTFDLAPGRYELVCNVPGHYKSGMVTEFQVK